MHRYTVFPCATLKYSGDRAEQYTITVAAHKVGPKLQIFHFNAAAVFFSNQVIHPVIF